MADLGHAVYTLSVDSSQYESGMSRAEVTARRLTANIGAQFKNLAAGLTTAAVGITATITTSVMRTGMRFNQIYKDASIGLETMLGSAKKAKDFLNGLIEFAKKTPFELKSLIPISQQLMAVGFNAKEVLPTLRALGDATSALGASPFMLQRIVTQFGQMVAKGRVMGEELRVLAETGVPVYQALADGLGISTEQLMEEMRKGTVSAKTAIDHITKYMSDNYGGMMKEMAKTFTGAKSNIVDAYDQLTGQLTKPIFDFLAKRLVALSGFLGDNAERIKRIAGSIGQLFIPMLKSVGKWVKSLTERFTPLVDRVEALAASGKSIGDLIPVARELKVLLSGVGAAFLSMGLNRIPFIGAFIPAIPTWLAVMGGFVATNEKLMLQLRTVFSRFAAQAGPIIEEVAKVLGEILTEVLDALVPILPDLADAFIAVMRAIKPLIPTLGNILVKMVEIGTQLLEIVVPAFSSFVGFASRMVDVITDLSPAIISLGSAFAGLLVLTRVNAALRTSMYFMRAGKGVFNFATGRNGGRSLQGAKSLLPFAPWLIPIAGSALQRGGPRAAAIGRLLGGFGRPMPRGVQRGAEVARRAAGAFNASNLLFGGMSLWSIMRGDGVRARIAQAGLRAGGKTLADEFGITKMIAKAGGAKAAAVGFANRVKSAGVTAATLGVLSELLETVIERSKPAAAGVNKVGGAVAGMSAAANASVGVFAKLKKAGMATIVSMIKGAGLFIAKWSLIIGAVAGVGYAIWRHIQNQKELREYMEASSQATIENSKIFTKLNNAYTRSGKGIDEIAGKLREVREQMSGMRSSIMQATDAMQSQAISADTLANISLKKAMANFKDNIAALGQAGVNPAVLDAWSAAFKKGETSVAKVAQALRNGAMNTAQINTWMERANVPLAKYETTSRRLLELERKRNDALRNQKKAARDLLEQYPFLAKGLTPTGEFRGIDQTARRRYDRNQRWMAAAAGALNPITAAAMRSTRLTKQFMDLDSSLPQFQTRWEQLWDRMKEVRNMNITATNRLTKKGTEMGLPPGLIDAIAGYKASSGQDLADNLGRIISAAEDLGKIPKMPANFLSGVTGDRFREFLSSLGEAGKFINPQQFQKTMQMLGGRFSAVKANRGQSTQTMIAVAGDLSKTLRRTLSMDSGALGAGQIDAVQRALEMLGRSGKLQAGARTAGKTILSGVAEGLAENEGIAKSKIDKVTKDLMQIVSRRDFSTLGGRKLEQLAEGIHKKRKVPTQAIVNVIQRMQDVSLTALDRWQGKMARQGRLALFSALPKGAALRELRQIGGLNGANTAEGFIKGLGDIGQGLVQVVGAAGKDGRRKAQEVGQSVGKTVHRAWSTSVSSQNWLKPVEDQLEKVAGKKAKINVEFSGKWTGDGLGASMGGRAVGSLGAIAQKAMAAVPGNQVISSSYRPGAVTMSGNRSYHDNPHNPAHDIAGSNLMGVFNYLLRRYGSSLRELIYTPAGFGIKNGRRVPLSFWGPKINATHMNHVHFADTGGTIKGPALIRQGPITESHIPHNRHGADMLADMLVAAGKRSGKRREGRLTMKVENWEQGIVSIGEAIFDELDADDRHDRSIGRMNVS